MNSLVWLRKTVYDGEASGGPSMVVTSRGGVKRHVRGDLTHLPTSPGISTWVILAESEPAVVPGYYEARYNPIRRFYRWPLDTLFKPLVPMLGYEKAAKYRWYTGKIGLVLGGVLLTYYYFKYNTNDWTRKGGWRVLHSIENVVPGDPRYPMVSDRKVGADYASGNFKNSPI
ncbi:hypothetical protein E2C01_021010 [Portunus trituberculatus]|uniref:Uncharacterized protein n=1 Tax=Portunus trituberculatus TaxID=210409 RepID=A0A5B7E399_PORTR|nr:hypothetical protein [Portunus trituberculatus]